MTKYLDQLKEMTRRFDKLMGDISHVDNFGGGSDDKFLEIIIRASVVRQREAIDAIVALCESGHAAFSVCLLRPAYEEMLWLKYFNKNPQEAAPLCLRLSLVGVGRSIEAQRAHVKDEVMHDLGFSKRFLTGFKAMMEFNLVWLRGCGARLGWRKNSDSPTLTLIAQAVGRKEEYDYVYEATSRFVHFSPHELCRRGWGNPDRINISSDFFAPHWGRFAIYWAIRIYVLTIVEVWDSLKIEAWEGDNEMGEEVTELLKEFHYVPIVTTDELEWFVSGRAPSVPNRGVPR